MGKPKISCSKVDHNLMEQFIRQALSQNTLRLVRDHLAGCRECWNRWNIFRWDKAKGTRGYEELKEYLGSSFQEYFDASWALADEWKKRNPQTREEIELFYKEVPFYLYNLLIWQESGQRPRYSDYALPYLQKYNCKTICDFGCGIGNDGLLLIEKGFNVIFCDFDNPSTKFLRWRLKKRGLSAIFIAPPEVAHAGSFDTLWAMDVLEHLPEPHITLSPFLEIARVFIHDTEHAGESQGRHPFHMNHSLKYLRELFERFSYQRDSLIVEMELWYKPAS